jgi:CxxC-x17-CxxC domain-containing protein
MAFSDRELICRDCQGTFVFTAGEQEFYATKGLQHDPVRCPSCRASRRTMRPEERDEAPSYGVFVSWGGRTPRQLHAATCHECGQTTEIPFMPRGDRPVFCSNCYNAVRERQEAAEEAAAARLAALVAGTAATTEDAEDEDAEPAANVVVPAAE